MTGPLRGPDGLWSEQMPGLDCISRGHLLVQHEQPGAWTVAPDSYVRVPWAQWCIWCGGGVSNEDVG